MKSLISLGLILIVNCLHNYSMVYAQELKLVDLADLTEEWVASKDSVITYSNLHISPASRPGNYSNTPKDSIGRTIINSKIIFNNTEIEEIILENFSFINGIAFEDCAVDYLVAFNSYFKSLTLIGSLTSVQLDNNYFDNKSGIKVIGNPGSDISKSNDDVPTDFNLSNNTFSDFYLHNQLGTYAINIWHNSFKNFYGNFSVESEFASIRDNTFIDNENGRALLSLKTKNFSLINNHFQTDFALFNSVLTGQMDFENNTFDKSVSLTRVSFPQDFNNISWKQFHGRKLSIGNGRMFMGVKNEIPTLNLYKALSLSDFEDETSYNALISLYSRLLTIFKSNGNIISSNDCYAEMKEIEGKKYESLYVNESSFKNFFRWKLNQLMKFYTNHGTDPALAIVISVYVILAFAIFYFFFPSEWDVTSKGKLIQNYKDFIQKNDKGYAKPFMLMAFGFGVSLVNALTLSLNSFTTLGFGSIPTKGLARYICIIQGFIGWFLLSIFTVALINQVLA